MCTAPYTVSEPSGTAERLMRFIAFEPATRMADAIVQDSGGKELRIVKGAFHAVVEVTATPATARALFGRHARMRAKRRPAGMPICSP